MLLCKLLREDERGVCRESWYFLSECWCCCNSRQALLYIANIPSLVALRSWFDTVSQSRGSLLNRILKIVFKHCLMTCCPPCRSCYGAIPTEALRCGAKSSSCPLAPPGKHDEQWLFACCWRKYPDSHSEIIESTFCTDGSKSVNSRCVSATAHQEESRRIFGDSNLK